MHKELYHFSCLCLFQVSPEEFPTDSLQGVGDEIFVNESVPIILPTAIKLHSGLWRVCVYYEDMGKLSTLVQCSKTC